MLCISLQIAIATLEDDEAAALAEALARVREPWEPETTLRNLDLTAQARRDPPWAAEIRQALHHSTRN